MIHARHQESESEQISFFERSYERFLRAQASVGGESRFYRVGGTIVRLTFAGEGLVPYVTPALEHLRVPPAEPGLTLCVWDSRSTSVTMLPPPCAWEDITPQGEVTGFTSSRIKFAFHWPDFSVNLLDHSRRTGIYWVTDARTVPSWDQAIPLRTLFHWWLEANGCQILHGAAVGTDGGAVLLTGRSGKGKSTAALSCLQAGLYYLGDDCVIVRLEPEPIVYSLYCAAKLNADDIAHFPSLAALVRNPEQAGKEKQVMFLYPSFGRQLVPELRLKAIVLPQIAESGETRVTPAPGWKVRHALSSMAELQLPHVGRRTRDFVCRLYAAVPGYTLDAGRRLDTIPAAIADLLDRSRVAPPAQGPQPADARDACPTPLVSAIIVVRDGERDVRNAVEHVLSQDYPALELIVVDDGSTDRTAEIAAQLPYDIRYVKNARAGRAAARNRGISEASGEFLAFPDTGHLWPENAVRRLVDELLLDPTADVAHGEAQFVRRNPDNGEYERIGDPRRDTVFRAAAAVFRRSAFSTGGRFDGAREPAEDSAWLVRATASHVRIRRVAEVTLLLKRPGVRVGGGMTLDELGALRLVKETLDRKRAQEARNRVSR